MLEEPVVVHSESGDEQTTHVVHALMQFLLAVRYRKHVVFSALVVAALLGGVYYATATRYYGANAELFVMRTGPDTLSPSMTSEGTRQQNLMPTFESLFTCTKVLEGALGYLRPEDRIDMAGAPRETWAAILQENLSTQVQQGTHIIEIGYRSKDPKAAVNVVNAVVQSYVDFLDKTHKSTAGEIIRVLTKEKVELAERLVRKEQELLEASYQFGDLGIRSDSRVLHPVVQRAIYFNEVLIETQKERVGLEVSLAAVQAAVRNGEDLQQHIMTVADAVGREMLLRTLGFNPRDSYAQANLELELLEDHAVLEAMRKEGLGPAHPKVIARMDKIRLTEQYLMGYQQRINDRLTEIQNSQLGPMLVNMVQQQLSETWQREASLQVRFEQAQADAVNRNGQLAHLQIIEHDLKWLRSLQDKLLDKIADIELKHDGQEVRTAVVHEPVEAEAPVSPNLRRVIMMALAAGLAAGLALVYVLDILDDRFRSAEEIQGQLSVPVLAMVRQLPSVDTEGLHVAPNSSQCEAFRTLRTALALADREARQIVISSAEPGDGKTTVLANLAVSYAQSKKRTLLIDADLRRPRLTAMMGMRGTDGLSGIIRGQDDVVEMATAHIRSSGIERLDVLASGPRPTNPAELLANPRFSELLAWAESVYDQILIDSPPALATSDAAVIGRLVDGVVMVVQPDKNRRRLVIRAAESFARLKIPLLGIVVNRVSSDNDRSCYGYGGGYGYAYDYEGEYEGDEGEDDAAFAPRSEEGVPAMKLADRSVHQEADPPAGIVPRRVA